MRSDLETEQQPADRASESPPQLPDEPYYRRPARGEQSRRWGAILLVIGVVWLVFMVGVQGSLFGPGFVERSAALPAQSFSAERVIVTGFNDNITLVGWGEDEIQLEGERYGFGWNGGAAEDALEGVEVVATQNGDTLTIEVRRPPALTQLINGERPYVDLRISLPAGVVVEASTANGDLLAEGLRGDLTLGTISGQIETDGTEGSLALRTTSGDADVTDHRGPLTGNSVSGQISAGGDIADPQIETVSGDVQLDGVSGAVTISSISGEIAVEAARDATLRLESTSGNISAEGDLAAADSAISNISGDVNLVLPADANLRLDASTVSGELSADLPLRDLEAGSRRLSGRLGDGGAALNISTTSGNVTIEGQ